MGNLRKLRRSVAQNKKKQLGARRMQAGTLKGVKIRKAKKVESPAAQKTKGKTSRFLAGVKKRPGLVAGAALVAAAAISTPWTVPLGKQLIEDLREKDPKQSLVAETKAGSDAEGRLDVYAADRWNIFIAIDALRDHEPPVITGVEDKVVSIGSTIRYKEGVTAFDNFDGEVKVSVDVSNVNETEEGIYTVFYSAVDEAGNASEVSAEFTFVTPDGNLYDLEYFPDEEGYDASELPILVEKVFSSICDDEMDQRTKAENIYAWIWDHIGYLGAAHDGEDMVMEAIAGLHRRGGNCFTFTSISKALLDRAGIESIIVQKIPMEWRSDHFWLLVNIDGEWYHFDSTPRAAGGYFCLWTDEQMLEYSEQHGDCFDFDLRDYPRTPGEIAERFLVKFYPDGVDEAAEEEVGVEEVDETEASDEE